MTPRRAPMPAAISQFSIEIEETTACQAPDCRERVGSASGNRCDPFSAGPGRLQVEDQNIGTLRANPKTMARPMPRGHIPARAIPGARAEAEAPPPLRSSRPE
jgi:hypothetical protein